jgi:hypothetical protein
MGFDRLKRLVKSGKKWCNKFEELVKGAWKNIKEIKEKILKRKIKPPVKKPAPSLSSDEKEKISNYFKKFEEYCVSKEISDYMYIFSLPFNEKNQLKKEYPKRVFTRKTLTELGIETFKRHEIISKFLKEKFKKDFEIERVKNYSLGELYNLLHDGYEIRAAKKALETLKDYSISSKKKNDFEEEIKKIDEKLENFKEKVSEVKI